MHRFSFVSRGAIGDCVDFLHFFLFGMFQVVQGVQPLVAGVDDGRPVAHGRLGHGTRQREIPHRAPPVLAVGTPAGPRPGPRSR